MGLIDQLLDIAINTFGIFIQLLVSMFTFVVVALEGILHVFGAR